MLGCSAGKIQNKEWILDSKGSFFKLAKSLISSKGMSILQKIFISIVICSPIDWKRGRVSIEAAAVKIDVQNLTASVICADTRTNKLLLSLENPISTFFPFSSRLLLFPIHFFCIIWSLINHVSYHAHGQGIINCSSLISVSFHSVDTYVFIFCTSFFVDFYFPI